MKSIDIKNAEKGLLEIDAGFEYIEKVKSHGLELSTLTNKNKVLIIDELKIKYKLETLLKISGLSKSSYYYSLKHQDFDNKNKDIIDMIKTIYEENESRYGYRRIALELRIQNHIVNHKKVKRLMSKLGLYGLNQKAPKYNSYRGKVGTILDNKLLDTYTNSNGYTNYKRNFKTKSPNEKWSTDISMFKIKYGKLYLSPIMDLYDSSIISYNISTSPILFQVKDMIDKAFNSNTNLNGLIFHSDQGWQYQQKSYQNKLKELGIIQSMSRKGNCLDNSPMENFFSIMKKEMFYGKEDTFTSLDDLKKKMDDYIYYYNNKRISLKRKGLTPIQYRNKALLKT